MIYLALRIEGDEIDFESLTERLNLGEIYFCKKGELKPDGDIFESDVWKASCECRDIDCFDSKLGNGLKKYILKKNFCLPWQKRTRQPFG